MNKLLSCFIFLSFLSSCGFEIKKTKGLDIVYSENSRGESIPLSAINTFSTCNNTNKNAQMISKIFNNGDYVNFAFPYRPSLFSIISYAGKYELLKSSVRQSKNGYTLIERPEVFQPCFEYDYSEDHSYEAATASALYSFNNIQEKLSSFNLNLAPVQLVIAPKVIEIKETKKGRTVHRETTELINNAFYDPNEKQILFLPQGKPHNGVVPYNGVPMWQIPFVGAHEYGHHIFSSLFPNFIFDQTIRKSNKLCFDSSHKHTQALNEEGFSLKKQRVVKLSQVITVINEAYADLFSKFVLGEDFNLKGIGCLEKSRSVEDSVFANNRPKLLNKDALDEFFKSQKIMKSTNCAVHTNFQDPHMMGAVIAHLLYKIMINLDLSETQKIQALIRWVEDLNLNYYSYKFKSNEKVLELMTIKGINAFLSEKDLDQSNLCSLIANHYPGLHSYYSCK